VLLLPWKVLPWTCKLVIAPPCKLPAEIAPPCKLDVPRRELERKFEIVFLAEVVQIKAKTKTYVLHQVPSQSESDLGGQRAFEYCCMWSAGNWSRKVKENSQNSFGMTYSF
jgi:hypothetical protein